MTSNGDVYFDTQKPTAQLRQACPARTLRTWRAGARIEVDDIKRHPMDFALWKAQKPGEPAWNSPVGHGPSRLAYRVLGDEHEVSGRDDRHSLRRRRI